MKGSTPSRRTPVAPADDSLDQSELTATLTWTTDGLSQTLDARLVNTVSGQVEQKSADPAVETLDFDGLMTDGQSYYALSRFVLNGEPGPWSQSNTILAAA